MADQAAPLAATRSVARQEAPKQRAARPDFATLTGRLLAFGGIAGGLIMEGGKLRDVAQVTAAVIVFGGTCGALMVSTPMGILIGAVRRLTHIFIDRIDSPWMAPISRRFARRCSSIS